VSIQSTNPFAPPETDALVANPRTEHDQFIISQAESMLEPGERLLYTAFVIKAPPLWVQILFSGLIMLLFIHPFLAACTNKRLILFKTKNGWVKPKMLNLGTDQIEWANVQRIDVGGIANNRSMKFKFNDGSDRTLRIGPWAKFVSGQKAFFEFVQSFDPTRL
jgi:hypothetical protein